MMKGVVVVVVGWLVGWLVGFRVQGCRMQGGVNPFCI